MKVTICQLPNEHTHLEGAWAGLAEHCRAEGSELVLLPEMPFYPWLAARRKVDRREWEAAVAVHRAWIPRLAELGGAAVAGSMPAIRRDRWLNEGFIWTPDAGHRGVHGKCMLPNEPGYWEATWYSRGDGRFDSFQAGKARAGYLICTELWFAERARQYGRQGAHLLLCPRATPDSSLERWLVGGRAAGIVAGAYCLSSNFVGPCRDMTFGGQGWITGPEGEVLATTSEQEPWQTLELDLEQAEAAKETYPRYVEG